VSADTSRTEGKRLSGEGIVVGLQVVGENRLLGRGWRGEPTATRRALDEWITQSSRLLSWPMVFIFVTLGLAITACNQRNEPGESQQQPAQVTRKPAIGGIYRRPLANDPASLDPARLRDIYGVTVVNQVFDGLVEFDAHLNVLPALAESWSASRDGLVWTFRLRRGVRFHNGREVVAADVVYSLSRFLDPTVGSPRTWFLDKVRGAPAFLAGTTKALDGIRAIDRYTVQIVLSEAFAPFISILGLPHLVIVPKEEVEREGADFASSPVGTGPFRFVQWNRGEEIVLEANEHYFRGRPFLDRVRFVIFPGTPLNDMMQAFEHGELEESPIPPDKRQALLKANTYRVIRKPTLGLLIIGFNVERPPFDRQKIRQSFNYAIDKINLNDEVQGARNVVARGILPPGMPGYTPQIHGYDYDPAKAMDLLAQAGHPAGKDLAPMTLSSSAKGVDSHQEFRALQRYLTFIGIEVNRKQFENWPSFRQALLRGESELFRFSWYADYPDPDNIFYPLFHSQSEANFFRYRNHVVDDLLDKARRETDELQRAKLYREVEQIILNDAPAAILLHYTYEQVFQPYVEGVEVSALGDPYIPLHKVRLKQSWPASTSQ
jgi:oligopeptide transport system substrate-binding protein